ncbi:hypothetical protein GCM10010193_25300 [Kitasatospora atroaurantiaca]|uniref:Dirigent-like protein n=1 Tax=Kitasatospora atroaurantiaca TaxID=285545 RepID=A0A561F0K7_9ACTN|nr:hypothetical protein [Kitasatospora atroaurantiaca]TWE21400.1 hypothetical protein FB465_6583 [Kitasatospora atroaurantiaca]
MIKAHSRGLGLRAASACAAAAMLAVGLGAATPAVAQDRGHGGHGRGEYTVAVALVEQPPVFGDPNSMKPGDVLLFEEPAVDPGDGHQIGDSLTRVQLLEGGSYLLDCTVRLADGNLVFSGGEEFAHMEHSTFAVTGGTERFSGAHGQVDITLTTINGAASDLLTFHLRR